MFKSLQCRGLGKIRNELQSRHGFKEDYTAVMILKNPAVPSEHGMVSGIQRTLASISASGDIKVLFNLNRRKVGSIKPNLQRREDNEKFLVALESILAAGLVFIAYYKNEKLYYSLLSLQRQAFLDLCKAGTSAHFSGSLLDITDTGNRLLFHRICNDVDALAQENYVSVGPIEPRTYFPELIPVLFSRFDWASGLSTESFALSMASLTWFVSHKNPQLYHFKSASVFPGNTLDETINFDRHFRNGGHFRNEGLKVICSKGKKEADKTMFKILLLYTGSNSDKLTSADGKISIKNYLSLGDGTLQRIRCQLTAKDGVIQVRCSVLGQAAKSRGSNGLSTVSECTSYMNHHGLTSASLKCLPYKKHLIDSMLQGLSKFSVLP